MLVAWVKAIDWPDFQLQTCRQVTKETAIAPIASGPECHFQAYSNVAAIRWHLLLASSTSTIAHSRSNSVASYEITAANLNETASHRNRQSCLTCACSAVFTNHTWISWDSENAPDLDNAHHPWNADNCPNADHIRAGHGLGSQLSSSGAYVDESDAQSLLRCRIHHHLHNHCNPS